MKKKFLTVVTLLVVLLVAALAFVACENYGDKNKEEDEATTPTYTHTIKNGTFYNASTTATDTSGDKAVLDKVTDWTQTTASLTTSKSGESGVLNAAVDLADTDAFSSFASKYLRVYEDADGHELENAFTAKNPGVDPKTPMVNKTDKDGKTIVDADGNPETQREDTNAVVIASTKTPGSLYLASSSFTLERDSVYLFQFSVASTVDTSDETKKPGAWVILSGTDMEYNFRSINTNGDWKTYYLFIQTNKYNTMSVTANLWLGYGPKVHSSAADDKSIYATRGVAFFDNVLCEKVDKATLTTQIKDEGVATYGDYVYDADRFENDDFDAFKAAIASTKDASGNKYVNAKSYYALINADMELRNKLSSYGDSSSYLKYYYTFRENNGSNNLKKYTATSSATSFDAKYYGSVDLSKLYTISDGTEHKDNYTVTTTNGGIGSGVGFYAMSYEDWKNKVMEDDEHNLTTAEESYALMLYNKELMASKITSSETITVEANKYYAVSVWVLVWAKTYEEDGKVNYYPAYSATTKPTEPTFTGAQNQLFTLLDYTEENDVKTAKIAAMQSVVDSTATVTESERASAVTAMGNIAYNGDASATYRTNAAAWLKSLLGTEDDTATLAESFYYTYLYYATQKTEFVDDEWKLTSVPGVTEKAEAIETLYKYECSKNLASYKEISNKKADYQTKLDAYNTAKAEYDAQYIEWQDLNGSPKATIKLTGAGDVPEQTVAIPQGEAISEWTKVTFFVQGNQLSSRQLTLEMALGTGNDYSTYMIGGAFFDNVEVKQFANDDLPAGAVFTKLSKMESIDELKFGSLVGDVAELSDEEAQNIVDSNWSAETASGTAESDADGVKLSVAANTQIGKIDVSGSEKYLYVLSYENEVATASTLKYTGEDAVEIKPNKFYRFAFLVKTVDVNEEKGVNIKLLYGKDKDSVTETKDSSVTKYTNNSEDWAEVVYYVCGDLVDTYYLGLEVGMGSGTRFITDDYVSGKVMLAAFNCLEIDYDEYNKAATGDKIIKSVSLYNIKKDIDSASTVFTNPYYAKIDYSATDKDEFDENGKLTGIATTSNWSKDTALSFSNTYDKPANVTLDANTKKLTWDESKGISNDAEVDVAGYEIWAKYTDDEEKAKEILFDKVASGTTEYNVAGDWSATRPTYFAVKAIGNDGVSAISAYTTNTLGAAGQNGIPAAATTEKEAKAQAGTVLKDSAMFGNEVGVDYISPYPTLLKLTSTYNNVLTVKSNTLSSGLGADGYYKISVWAKTDVGTYMSVTLGGTSGSLQATTNASQLGFVYVTTNNEWKEYSFFVKTGNFNAKMYVQYSLGNPYAVKKTMTGADNKTYYVTSDLSKGNAYFDAIRVSTITEDEYLAVKAADENKGAETFADVKEITHDTVYKTIPNYAYLMEYVIDSFDAFTEATTAANDNDALGNTPSNYNRSYDSDLGTEKTLASYGVYNAQSASDNMKTAIKQLYSYTGDDKEIVYPFSKYIKDIYGDKFDCSEWEETEWQDFMTTFLSVDRKDSQGNVIYDGRENVLVMSNKSEKGYAQNYTLGSSYQYSAKAGSYTKITFSARTLIARVIAEKTKDSNGDTVTTYTYTKDNAFGEFRVTPASGTKDTISVKINSAVYGLDENNVYEDVTYTVYLYNPTETANSIGWAFYLGDEDADDDETKTPNYLDDYIVGMMAIDLVSAEDVTEEEYTAAVEAAKASNATTYTYEYKEEEEAETPEEDDKKDEEEEKESFWDKIVKNEYFWLYISSFIIALVIIVAVIVILVRRWKKKHPKEVNVENNVKTKKDGNVEPVVETAPVEKEEPLEADEYTDEVAPKFVQRTTKNKSRKDRKSGK